MQSLVEQQVGFGVELIDTESQIPRDNSKMRFSVNIYIRSIIDYKYSLC